MQTQDEYIQDHLGSFSPSSGQQAPITPPGIEKLVIEVYPEEPEATDIDNDTELIEAILADHTAYKQAQQQRAIQQDKPIGYVSNARNATASSDLFQFWAPAEETSIGIGSIVRHTSMQGQQVNTYAIVVQTTGNTLGLDDYAVHVYEQDALPPLEGIVPAPSARRPVVHYQAKVIASTQKHQRPVQSGPVYPVMAKDLGAVHNKQTIWPDARSILLGFYEDAVGDFGIFGEERERVLGPKQGHAIFSGLPGAGKTSLFLTLDISLYGQLRNMTEAPVPRVATLAINVKGGDLLFLDHLAPQDIDERDQRMWRAAGIDVERPPFGRVIVYTPLKDDGINRDSLRSHPDVDVPNYSETRDFALGIQDIWPYLHLFFDEASTPASGLIAEIAEHFQQDTSDDFTLANIMTLFEQEIDQLRNGRHGRWTEFNLSTIRAVKQRFKSLPTILKGLIDVTGKGFGLDTLTDLRPYDMVIIDIERIMANPSDLQVAESTIKIITAYILRQLTEAMTKGICDVDHIIVFADELNRLAPRDKSEGIGDYLSQLARTTRDRGIVLFGAGQFRSGINEDILKAASVHYSMRTPEHELNDRIYAPLTPEVKARLTQLEPGQVLVQYPSLRTAVFAQFPRPFVMSGAQSWKERFPTSEDRSIETCVHKRLTLLDVTRAPTFSTVESAMLEKIQHQTPIKKKEMQTDIIRLLRNIEMTYKVMREQPGSLSPWQYFEHGLNTLYPPRPADITTKSTPRHFAGSEVDFNE